MYPTLKKTLKYSLILITLLLTERISAQCTPVTFKDLQACIESVSVMKSSLKKMRNEEAGSLGALFYSYFEKADYTAYKNLFLPADWFGMTEKEFADWRMILQTAGIEVEGIIETTSGGQSFGIVKYTYVLDDQLIYETFFAKKAGSVWRPTSMKEEQDQIALTNLVKYMNVRYLDALVTSSRNSNRTAGYATSAIHSETLMQSRDSLKVSNHVEYLLRYNDEAHYMTKDKFNQDRLRDTSFVSFLTEMKLNDTQSDVVMKLIFAQDYLRAATIADEYSEITYTYSPFVDKIREVYGKDRLKKWDHVNNKWD